MGGKGGNFTTECDVGVEIHYIVDKEAYIADLLCTEPCSVHAVWRWNNSNSIGYGRVKKSVQFPL